MRWTFLLALALGCGETNGVCIYDDTVVGLEDTCWRGSVERTCQTSGATFVANGDCDEEGYTYDCADEIPPSTWERIGVEPWVSGFRVADREQCLPDAE